MSSAAFAVIGSFLGMMLAAALCTACYRRYEAVQQAGKKCVLIEILPAVVCTVVDLYGLSTMVPLIPFHLGDTSNMRDDEIESWSGAINSAQQLGVVFGCIVLGYACDRFGALNALRVTMVGDAIFFALTGFTTSPQLLIVVRLVAGFFSPLVPAVASIFEVIAAEDTVTAMGYNGLAVVVGFASGTASVALYGPLGFMGIGLLSAGLASVALVTTLPCWSFNSRSASVTEVAARPEPEGVRAALRSPTFLTQAVSAFSLFFYFNGTQTFLVLDLRSRFGFDAGLTSLVYLSCPFWYVLAIFIVPDFAKKYGFQRLITSGLLIVCLASCLLAIPAVNDSLGALLVLWSTANFGFSCCLIPVNARAKLIGMHQTRNGTGQITGLSKVVQSIGQAFAPITAAQLLIHVGPWAPWALIAALQVITLLVYLSLGLALHKDPDWSRIAYAAPPAPSADYPQAPEGGIPLAGGSVRGTDAAMEAASAGNSMSIPLSFKGDGPRQSQSLFGSLSNLAVGESLKAI